MPNKQNATEIQWADKDQNSDFLPLIQPKYPIISELYQLFTMQL